MNAKKALSMLIAILLGTATLPLSVYSEELTSGAEFEKMYDGDNYHYEIFVSYEVGENSEIGSIVPKDSDPLDTFISVESDATYPISEEFPFTVTVKGANSYGEAAPVNGDTRWVFESWSIDDYDEHTEHTDTSSNPVSEFVIHVADGVTISDYYIIYVTVKQQMFVDGEWLPVEDSDPVTLYRRVNFQLPEVTPTAPPEHEGVDQTFQIEVDSNFIATLGMPYDHEVTPVVIDNTIVSVEVTERYTSDEYGDNKYLTKFTFKGLKAGNTTVDVYDGDAVIWRYEVTVTDNSGSGDGESEVTPTTRAPRIADINDTIVSGIKNLQLMPNTFYPFTVTGAGTANTNPVTGDTRWVPQYWRMESGTTQQTSWRIGAKAGINEVRTIPIRVYLQEQRYNSSTGWEMTGVVDYITAEVTTTTYYDPSQLHQPKLIAAYNGAKGIGIKFYREDAATEYVIHRKFNGIWDYVCAVSATDPSLQFSGNTIMFTDTSVAQNYGKGYIYSVSASDDGTNYTSYDTKGAAIYRLTPPSLTKITNSASGTVTVTWKGVFGRTETNGAYDLQYTEYKDGAAGSFKSVTALPGYNNLTLSATVSGLKKGSRYVFRIRCSKTNKDRGTYYSEYSPWLSVIIGK